jgi:U3 small nucleolar RNA-associated protein 19
MLEGEFSKNVKKAPVIEFVIPKKIFTRQGPGSEVEDSLLVNTWDFS